jgi:hypothetical protein
MLGNQESSEYRNQSIAERRYVLMDVSLFTDDFLDPARLQVSAESSGFHLEVPGALVTMIQQAQTGETLLTDILYAYLRMTYRELQRRPPPEQRESSQSRISDWAKRVERSLSGKEVKVLRSKAALATERLLKVYAPLIDGATSPLFGSFSQSGSEAATRPLHTIGRYEAIAAADSQELLPVLRRRYRDELGIGFVHPLLDLYFLQVYHAELVGLAASPDQPRQLISYGTVTSRILNWVVQAIDFTPPGQHHPSPTDIDRQTQEDRDKQTLKAFLQKFVSDTLRKLPYTMLSGFAISSIWSGRLESPVPIVLCALVEGAIDLALAAKDSSLPEYQKNRLIRFSLILILLVAVALWVAKSWRFWPLPPHKSEIIQSLLPTDFNPSPAPTLSPSLTSEMTSRPVPAGSNPPPAPTLSPAPAPTATQFFGEPGIVIPDVIPEGQAHSPEISPSGYADGYCLYVVQPRDTLSGIAARFQIPLSSIRAADNQPLTERLLLHRKLEIAANCCRPLGGQGATYTVHAGERLSTIARQYGTTVTAIVSANGLQDANYIQAGQMLCIPLK